MNKKHTSILLSPEAFDYSWAGQEPCAYALDQSQKIQRARVAIQGRLKEKRCAHVLRVAYTARRLAQTYGVDSYLAELAGLLHDWDKSLPKEDLIAKAQRLGILTDDMDPRVEPLLHAWTAEHSVAKEFEDVPREVLQAIGRHTLGDTDMQPLDMVLYLADALEPGRDYEGVNELRSFVGILSLPALYALSYKSSILGIVASGRYLYPEAAIIWNKWCVELQSLS